MTIRGGVFQCLGGVMVVVWKKKGGAKQVDIAMWLKIEAECVLYMAANSHPPNSCSAFLPHALHDFVPQIGEEGCKMGLVIYGPSQMGKTTWSRSLGRHNYYKGQFDLNSFNDTVDYHMFDDMDKFSFFKYKLCFGNEDFVISAKYRKERKIVGGKACIYICNSLPRPRDFGSSANFDWWI